MKVVVLAGGKGTRISEKTSVSPKPMVEIGGMPILEHIMGFYASHGHTDFVIACGHLGHVIKDYFASYRDRRADFTVSLRDGSIDYHGALPDDWTVTLVDTGTETMTGGRLARLRAHVGNETFMMTYGDGLSDVDLGQLLDHHRQTGRIATVTAVRPPARFGSLVIDDSDRVIAFEEKISSAEALINGGFFVLEPEIFEYVGDDTMPFEREPMQRLAVAGQLTAYRHNGFWKPMDTLRDRLELEALWEGGDAPWTQ
jgi:glucose-1-phosphate cytidylyltransferase